MFCLVINFRMDFKISGKIIDLGETQQVSDNFKKRNFVVEYIKNNPQYPEYISFELIKDKCSLLDDFVVNQSVEIFFNLKGRKWTNAAGETRYFNSLQVWKIEESKDTDNGASTSEDDSTEDEEEGSLW